MRKYLLILIAIPSLLIAEGPRFYHKDNIVNQEFENVYQDLRTQRFLTVLKSSSTIVYNDSQYFKISSAGEITQPYQPSFLATHVALTDVTGDGTSYTEAYGTEVFDQGGDYNNGTYTFTAPITGRYYFSATSRFQNVTNVVTYVQLTINTSNRTHTTTIFLPLAAATIYTLNISMVTDMDASDTCNILAEAGGTTKTIDIQSGSFSGSLIN